MKKSKCHWVRLWRLRIEMLAFDMGLLPEDRKVFIDTLMDMEVVNEYLLGTCVMIEQISQKEFRVYFNYNLIHD